MNTCVKAAAGLGLCCIAEMRRRPSLKGDHDIHWSSPGVCVGVGRGVHGEEIRRINNHKHLMQKGFDLNVAICTHNYYNIYTVTYVHIYIPSQL